MNTTKPDTEVIFTKKPARYGYIGLIELNRPNVLNALSVNMIFAMHDQLRSWAQDDQVYAVIITSSNQRAFCAGGDLKAVYQNGPQNYKVTQPFFMEEYKLNALIATYPKPYIALINGITLGGGCGISVHGTRVIAGETLQLAMPETRIGLYPDVGASYFLARTPNRIGMYLGLTGNSLHVGDAIFAKLVHTHIPVENFNAFIAAVMAEDLRNNAIELIDNVINKFKQNVTAELPQNVNIIERCFKQDSVEAIISSLMIEDSTWAHKQAEILQKNSPTSLKVTFKYINMAINMSLQQCFDLDAKLTLQFMQGHDLYAGIRAILIDKSGNPKWNPPTLDGVTDQTINKMFQ